MDIYFVREKLRYNVTKNKKYLRESRYHKIIEKKLFDYSDGILTISEKEKEFISNFTGKNNVFAIPCYVYDNYLKIDYKADDRKNLLFVGGDIETANLDGIRWFIEKIFPHICEKNINIKLMVVGLYNGKFVEKYQNENITFAGKVNDDELKKLYYDSKNELDDNYFDKEKNHHFCGDYIFLTH